MQSASSKKLENSIIQHGIFSPNESLKEIPTENLKYLLLPFYLADIFGRIQEDRKSNLDLSKKYFDEFIKLCNHYELVTKEQRKQWKTAFDNENYEPSREEKIQGFKDKKDLENKIKNLEKIKDEDTRREILTLNIRTKILKAIDDIRMIHLEGQMHAYKEKMDREKQHSNQQAADTREQKPKKMQVWHIPKADKNPEQPYVMSNKNWGCHGCDPMYNMKIKQELKDKVFQPGHSMPTMTMDEYADYAMKMYGDMEKNQKEADEAKRREEDKDQDKDDIVDMQTLKDREWDDWKDEHEKGAGNKMR